MNNAVYYIAPSDEMFEEIKGAAIRIWTEYDNSYGYVDEKLSQLIPMKNIRDNYMHIVGMFDSTNQARLRAIVSRDTWSRIHMAQYGTGE